MLLLDEALSKRLCTELRCRGKSVTTVSAEGLKGLKDPELLQALATQYGDQVVLVTADDKLPLEHEDGLRATGLTIATIDGRHDGPQDAWQRDVVHRWAHVMEVQPVGSIRRYSPKRSAPWTSRKLR